jgi:hypothetical protein
MRAFQAASLLFFAVGTLTNAFDDEVPAETVSHFFE